MRMVKCFSSFGGAMVLCVFVCGCVSEGIARVCESWTFLWLCEGDVVVEQFRRFPSEG